MFRFNSSRITLVGIFSVDNLSRDKAVHDKKIAGDFVLFRLRRWVGSVDWTKGALVIHGAFCDQPWPGNEAGDDRGLSRTVGSGDTRRTRLIRCACRNVLLCRAFVCNSRINFSVFCRGGKKSAKCDIKCCNSWNFRENAKKTHLITTLSTSYRFVLERLRFVLERLRFVLACLRFDLYVLDSSWHVVDSSWRVSAVLLIAVVLKTSNKSKITAISWLPGTGYIFNTHIMWYAELCQRGAGIAGGKNYERKKLMNPWTHPRTDPPSHPVQQRYNSSTTAVRKSVQSNMSIFFSVNNFWNTTNRK